MRVEGVGENAAALIRLILPLYRRIRLSASSAETILNSTEKAGAFFLDRFAGERTEIMYQACLDAKGKLLSVQKLSSGDVSFVHADIRTIGESLSATTAICRHGNATKQHRNRQNATQNRQQKQTQDLFHFHILPYFIRMNIV
jgi:DNA repair protein RadC